MNEDRLKGKWNQLKGELKKKWAQLTDDDLKYGEGNIDQLIGRIQERTGEKKEAIQQYLHKYMDDAQENMRH